MSKSEDFVCYQRSSGAIVQVGQAPSGSLRATSSIGYLLGVVGNPETQRVDTASKTVVDKHTFSAPTREGNTHTFSVPYGTWVHFDGQTTQVFATTLTIHVTAPGAYPVELTHDVYHKGEFTLNYVAH